VQPRKDCKILSLNMRRFDMLKEIIGAVSLFLTLYTLLCLPYLL
jgi:hypothetical protein